MPPISPLHTGTCVWGISRTPVTPNSSIFWERSPSLSPSHHLPTLLYPPLLSFINIFGAAFDKVTSIAWIVHHIYTRVLTNPAILDATYLSIYILRLYVVYKEHCSKESTDVWGDFKGEFYRVEWLLNEKVNCLVRWSCGLTKSLTDHLCWEVDWPSDSFRHNYQLFFGFS